MSGTTFRTLSIRGAALPETPGRGLIGNASTPLVTPRSIEGHDGIGVLFEYRVQIVPIPPDEGGARDIDSLIDLEKLTGSPVTVTIDLEATPPMLRGGTAISSSGAGMREINGIVATAAIVGIQQSVPVYELVIRPTLWLATLRTDSRAFNGAILDVLDCVLRGYGVDVDWRISGSFDIRRDLIRQAWETDWNFLLRLCEEFGLIVWFEHCDGKHLLVIADQAQAHRKQTEPYDTIRYHSANGHIDGEYVNELTLSRAVTLDKVEVHDNSYMSPRVAKSSMPYREEYSAAGRHSRELIETYLRADYAQPDARADMVNDSEAWREQARYLAQVQLEAAQCGRFRVSASGHLRNIESGKTYTLTNHPHAPANREYLVTATRLAIRETGAKSGFLCEYRVDVQFELHPHTEPYRMPCVTPRPRIEGFECATIVGPLASEICIDEHNRVLIQYAWDRNGQYDGKASIWVRMAGPWHGAQMGTVAHGRCGQQVLIGYVNGDPDRPIVAAFVADKLNEAPWKLPHNHALTGIRTRSLGNGDSSNHLALDDTEHRQQAQLASDYGKSSLGLGAIARIDGNAGRQDARGEGFELRTDKVGSVRAALGLLVTAYGRIGAKGKATELSETMALLTAARDLLENIAIEAQRHGAQDSLKDQAEVSRDIKESNARLKGNPTGEPVNFPEFESPAIAISTPDDLHTAAARNTHITSGHNTALTSIGHTSIAAGKSLYASVRERIALYAKKAIAIITPGPVHVESRTGTMTHQSQDDLRITSTNGIVQIVGKNGVDIRCQNTLLRIRPEGLTSYTPGVNLMHAASHATADPEAMPVDLPVTADSPGKLALHPVLVEDGGGFAIANQPYRMTLDDGQVISGVTNESGELNVVTSNAVTFGTIEFHSQSEPENVIGMASVTISRDAAAPVPAQKSELPLRTAAVGGKTINTPSEAATTQGKPPAFLTCDPMNFGMRTNRYANTPRTAITPPAGFSKTVEYPVTRTYTVTVKERLATIDWNALAGKPRKSMSDTISAVIRDALWTALQAGPFGLPPGELGQKGAMPDIEIVDPASGAMYGMLPTVTAAFVTGRWVMAIYDSAISRIVECAISGDKAFFSAYQGNLANIVYHEARHCQQTFWMVSLFSTYPGDYSKYGQMKKYFSNLVRKQIFNLALNTKFPGDDRVRVGMHAMLLFYYYWQMSEMRDKPGYEYVNADFESVEKAVCEIRGVTPDIARQMAPHKTGYYTHLHEEDAYATAEPVDSYWANESALFIREPGVCTDRYSTYIGALGVKGNG